MQPKHDFSVFDTPGAENENVRKLRSWRFFICIYLLVPAYRIHAVYFAAMNIGHARIGVQLGNNLIIITDFLLALALILPLLRKLRWAWFVATTMAVYRIVANLVVVVIMIRLEAPFEVLLPMLATILLSGLLLFVALKRSIRIVYRADYTRIWIPILTGSLMSIAHLGASVLVLTYAN